MFYRAFKTVPTLVLSCALLALAQGVNAQVDHSGHGAGDAFGRVHFDISCSLDAQEQFDRAVAMLHSFFYPETERAFRAIAEREPSCAMAHWGVAISQRPNPLTAPFPENLLRQGWTAVEAARAAAAPTPRERDWIDAIAVFFQDYETVNQQTRSVRYEGAMARLHARYPDDAEATVFYALALLEAVDLTDQRYSRQLEAADLLLRLQKALPEHPGIPHYLIHAYDYAPIAERGLPAARRYAALAPSAPHALHMPSHTFSTLGLWQEAIQSNLAADAANKAYAIGANPAAATNPAAIATRYHALDFLTNAYLQLGQDRSAKAILDERNSFATFESTSITANTAFAAIPVRYAIERGAWAEAASLPPMPPSAFKQAEAIVWFARALGAARSGDPSSARRSLDQLSDLRQIVAAADTYWAEQMAIQEEAAAAWIAFADRDEPKALALMRSAADREDRTEKHIAMENRLSPMRELLGELLLRANRPREALREFESSLQTIPNRFRSLAGAAEAAAQLGHSRRATTYYRNLLALAADADADSERPALTAARAFVGEQRGQ